MTSEAISVESVHETLDSPGIQKAASSSLRGLLAQVAELALASRQELNFFCFAEDHSHDAYLSCFPEKRPILFDNSPIYFGMAASAHWRWRKP